MGAFLIVQGRTQKVRLDLREIADDLELVGRGVDDVDPRALFKCLERQGLQGTTFQGFEDFEHRQGVSFHGSSLKSSVQRRERTEASEVFHFIHRATRVIAVHFLTSFP